MKKPILGFALAAMTLACAGVSQAADISGTWSGKFEGVKYGQSRFDPYGEVTVVTAGIINRPRHFSAPTPTASTLSMDLMVTFEYSKGDLLAGHWRERNADTTFSFVGSLPTADTVMCADASGFATGTVSGNTMRLCYVESGGNHMTGCVDHTKS